MTIGSFLIVVVLVSLVSAFLLLLATKVGIVEYLQTHGDSCISKMAQCYFCMSFWMMELCGTPCSRCAIIKLTTWLSVILPDWANERLQALKNISKKRNDFLFIGVIFYLLFQRRIQFGK